MVTQCLTTCGVGSKRSPSECVLWTPARPQCLRPMGMARAAPDQSHRNGKPFSWSKCAESNNHSFLLQHSCSSSLLPYHDPLPRLANFILNQLHIRNLPPQLAVHNKCTEFLDCWCAPSEGTAHPVPTFLYLCPSGVISYHSKVRSVPKQVSNLIPHFTFLHTRKCGVIALVGFICISLKT